MRSLVAAIALAALLLLPAASVGQSASAPQPSPTAKTLWGHRATSGSDELVGWMNAQEEDGDDTAMGPSAGCANNPAGAQAVPFTGNQDVDDQLWGSAIDRTYTLTLSPALNATLLLDKTKPVVATIHFGAGSCAGHPSIESTLSSGPTVLATASAGHTYTAGAPYPILALDMPLTVGEVAAGAPLVWTLHVTGTYYGAGFLGVGEPQGRSHLELPITGAVPAATNTTGNSTGSGSGTSSGSGSHTGSLSTTKTLTGAGSLSNGASKSSTAADNATGNGTKGKEDTPSLALPAVAVGLAAVVALVRRRLP